MTTKDFTANVISASKVVPDGNFKDSKASGVWDINEALDLIKGGNWPNVANINPSAFVDGLFQTTLYTGNGSTQSITTGLDLSSSNEGLVWLKERGDTGNHALYDTVRGATYGFEGSNSASTSAVESNGLTAFTSTGFSLGNRAVTNNNTDTYVSWTFKSKPKFFDIVTYNGTGSAQAIAHNLGSVPGMIITKATGIAYNWGVFHRSLGNTKALTLDTTGAAATGSEYWNDTDPTSTHFTVKNSNQTGDSGQGYIAYLFAHNDDDGGFGEPGDQDIIKCDTYTGNGSSTGPVVTLGFEPQFIMLKRTDDTENANWYVFDTMRGIVTGGDDPYLYWNTNAAEVAGNAIEVTSTGFQLKTSSSGFNGSSATYVYMAIRRGGMQTPTAASSVFAIDTYGGTSPTPPLFNSDFPTDMAFYKHKGNTTDFVIGSRLTGPNYLKTNANSAEATLTNFKWDFQNGYFDATGTISDYVSWMWKRTRGYFDVVAYTGTGSARTVAHNLGVAPEMMWMKMRSSTQNWAVYHKGANGGTDPEDYALELNSTSAEFNTATYFNDTAPTSSVFTVGTGNAVNKSSETYIAYLFATAAGVSKVGSYTGTGSSQNIDCGFTAGSSFVLIKRHDGTDSWYIADSLRGISSGQTDKILKLNSNDAEFTESDNSADYIAPHASGFNLPASSPFNGNGDDFLFYAIAAIS